MGRLLNWLVALGLTVGAGTIFSANANPIPANPTTTNPNPVYNLIGGQPYQPQQNNSQKQTTKRHSQRKGRGVREPKPYSDDYFEVWKSGGNICWKGKWGNKENSLEESLNSDLIGIRNFFSSQVAQYGYPLPKELESAEKLKNVIYSTSTGWTSGQMQPSYFWYGGCIPLVPLPIKPIVVPVIPDTAKPVKPVIVPPDTTVKGKKGNMLIRELEGNRHIGAGYFYRQGPLPTPTNPNQVNLQGLVASAELGHETEQIGIEAKARGLFGSKEAKSGNSQGNDDVSFVEATAGVYSPYMGVEAELIKDTADVWRYGGAASVTGQLYPNLIGRLYAGARNGDDNKPDFKYGGDLYVVFGNKFVKLHGEQSPNLWTKAYTNKGSITYGMPQLKAGVDLEAPPSWRLDDPEAQEMKVKEFGKKPVYGAFFEVKGSLDQNVGVGVETWGKVKAAETGYKTEVAEAGALLKIYFDIGK